MTPHIESKKEDICETVLLPGDPKRCKYIADKYLYNCRVVNTIRNMIAYTGLYKDTWVTIFPSGMGIPSVGIYAYELFKFYDVKRIIRIGTCGTIDKDVKLLDVVLATSAYSLSTFPLLFDKDTDKEYESNYILNNLIRSKADSLGIPLKCGRVLTSDVFDPYVSSEKFMSNFEGVDFLASEMEAFGLFYLAKKMGREATSLLTVVDSKYDNRSLTSIEREKSLNKMITLALETARENVYYK